MSLKEFRRAGHAPTLASAFLYFDVSFLVWVILGPLGPFLGESLKLTASQKGFLTAVPLLGGSFFRILLGWMTERIGGRKTGLIGLSLTLVPLLVAWQWASGFAQFLGVGLLATQPAWIVTWFGLAVGAVGMCEGPFWTTAIELGGRRGGTAAGLCNTGGNAGGLLAPIITPWVSGRLGWVWGIGLGSLVCLVGAALWWWIDPEERC